MDNSGLPGADTASSALPGNVPSSIDTSHKLRTEQGQRPMHLTEAKLRSDVQAIPQSIEISPSIIIPQGLTGTTFDPRPSQWIFRKPSENRIESIEHLPPQRRLTNKRSGKMRIINIPTSSVRLVGRNTLTHEDWSSKRDDLKQKLVGRMVDSHRRLVIAEDYSHSLWDALGEKLRLYPEMFEDHLAQSGGEANTTMSCPASLTESMLFEHYCLRWWRPLELRSFDQVTYLDPDRWDIVKNGATASWKTFSGPSSDRTGYYVVEGGGSRRESLTHRVSPTSNIFRQEQSLSDLSGLQGSSVVAREECLTVHMQCIKNCQLYIILVDPLPEVAYSVDSGEGELHEILDRWKPHAVLSPRGRPPQTAGNRFAGHFREVIERYRTELRSTLTDLDSWIGADKYSSDTAATIDPISAILKLVRVDTLELMRQIELGLEHIASVSMDEDMLQRSLDKWRQLFTWSIHELNSLKANLSGSMPKFRQWKAPQEYFDTVADLTRQLDQTLNKCEKAQADLRANIGIVDSRKSIAQAESVGKLTELGFVFLPMTFVSGLFSMQIRELQTKPPPFWAFIIAALCALGLAYAARLAIRSQIVKTSKNSLFSRLQASSAEPVTTRRFVWFILVSSVRFIGKCNWHVAALAATVTTLATMWIQVKLEASFKSVLTILIVLSLVVAATLLASSLGRVIQSVTTRLGEYEYGRSDRRRSERRAPAEPSRQSAALEV